MAAMWHGTMAVLMRDAWYILEWTDARDLRMIDMGTAEYINYARTFTIILYIYREWWNLLMTHIAWSFGNSNTHPDVLSTQRHTARYLVKLRSCKRVSDEMTHIACLCSMCIRRLRAYYSQFIVVYNTSTRPANLASLAAYWITYVSKCIIYIFIAVRMP